MNKNSFLTLLFSLVLCVSLLMCLAACGDTPDSSTTSGDGSSTTQAPQGQDGSSTQGTTAPSPTVDPTGKVNVKFFKVGKANATLIRTESSAILIDCGEEEDEDGNGKQDDGEEILQYLASKGVTKLDYVIVSQFNKNHYGSIPTILDGITVDRLVEPDYAKTGSLYEDYRNALDAADITPQVITDTTTITCDGLSITLYPATTTTTSADVDEFNSLAITVEYGDFSMLLASDIFGARVSSLLSDLSGKTFDILQVPNHGAYGDGTVDTLISAVDPDYAIIFASSNNPEDVRVMNILNGKNVTTFVTKNGSVEAKYEDGALTVKQ